MIKEIWKDIPGYEGLYQVSNLGRVRSLNYHRSGQVRVLSLGKLNKGYLGVGLCKNGKMKTYKVHRLVAIAFIPNPLNLPEVNHKDENKENNFVWVNEDGTIDLEKSNLEWVTAKQNSNHGSRNQRVAEKLCGIFINRSNQSKRVAQYSLKGKLIAEYPSTMEVERQTGFCNVCISACCLGKLKTSHGYIWKYLD